MNDDRTTEQRAADDNLLTAIADRFRAYGVLRDDEVVEHFVVAAYVNGLDLMDRNCARYAYAARDGGIGPYSAPIHVLYGLLDMARRWLDEDDD